MKTPRIPSSSQEDYLEFGRRILAGRARMVDVTPKEPSHRRAIARGRIHMTPETASAVTQGAIKKGDVLAVARVAGIQAAKRASDLIPLAEV